MLILRRIAACLMLAAVPFATSAHEFWIDVEAYQVPPGAPIVADLRVGTEYDGASQAYFPNAIRRFEIVTERGAAPVAGRIGDRPALRQAVEDDGLAIVVHATADSRLTWDDWASFESFVVHKAADWVLADHAARGLSREGVREIYSRHAKALVAVGSGAGADRATGLLTEIVAQANPYTDDLSGGLPVLVLYGGAARAGAQVEVFEKAPDGTVAVTLVRADDRGIATIPVRSGHRYLLDSVVLRAPSDTAAAETGAAWESLWASLTFEMP